MRVSYNQTKEPFQDKLFESDAKIQVGKWQKSKKYTIKSAGYKSWYSKTHGNSNATKDKLPQQEC